MRLKTLGGARMRQPLMSPVQISSRAEKLDFMLQPELALAFMILYLLTSLTFELPSSSVSPTSRYSHC